MPYIAKELRGKLDPLIDDLWYVCQNEEYQNKIDGVANYIISRLAVALLDPKPEDWSYSTMSRVIGLFECAKLEAYQRMLNPYECIAILNNGDTNEYAEVDKQINSKLIEEEEEQC